MIHHSAVSLDYLRDRLASNVTIRVRDIGTGRVSPLMQETMRRWEAAGYTYAPPCDNVTPDGRCDGHEKE